MNSYDQFLYFGLPAAYLIGSLPMGLIVGKIFGLGDVREIGSGNIGATNVLRTGNRVAAGLTLFLDMLKGLAAPGLLLLFYPKEAEFYEADIATLSVLFSLTAVIGHIFPLWLKFKGGKGVATAIGTFMALSPPIAFIMMGIWLITFAMSGYSSLSALVAFFLAPPILLFTESPEDLHAALYYSLIIMPIIFWRHKENIQRLLKGVEHSFTIGKS